MSKTPDFLSEEPVDMPAVQDETPPATEAKAPVEEPKPEVKAPEPKPDEPPASPPAEPEQPAAHHVPLATFLDQREAAAAAKRQADEYKAELDKIRAQQRQQPIPDRNADPDAYDEYVQAQVRREVREQAFQTSRRFAEMSHGKETTDAAFQWGVEKCDADPLFNQKVATAADPMELVVTEWRREQALAKIGDGSQLEAFLAWQASQNPSTPAGQPPQPPTPANRVPPAAPRPSIASAPSAGRSGSPEPLTGEGTFDRMFGG